MRAYRPPIAGGVGLLARGGHGAPRRQAGQLSVSWRRVEAGRFRSATSANLDISRVGTLRYMPPDGCMDARADVYAAGLVIYEMLTGLPSERFPSLGDRARQTAEDSRLARLNRLALRACDPDPKRRFRDAREMLLAARQQPARSHRLRRLMLAVGVLIGAASVFFWLHRPPPVGVNFVTEPYEAMIYLDGQLLRAPDGAPYRTPCTVHGHVGGSHRIVFQWDPFDPPVIDGKFDAGIVDLTENRQIIVIARRKPNDVAAAENPLLDGPRMERGHPFRLLRFGHELIDCDRHTRELCENLFVHCHQGNIQVLSERHKLAVMGRTSALRPPSGARGRNPRHVLVRT